jgi:anaerobic magnesium-protoporphyrin IX monomethyl ester cyclase
VTTVGELTPHDLIELQNEGFVSIYSAPWRWIPMLQKHGMLGGSLMLFRLTRLLMSKIFNGQRKTSDNFVSLGDGGFDRVHGPMLPTAAGSVPSVTSVIQSAGLIGITPSKKHVSPAGHYGSPASPNL